MPLGYRTKTEIEKAIRERDYMTLHESVMWNGQDAMAFAIDYAIQVGHDQGSDLVGVLIEEENEVD